MKSENKLCALFATVFLLVVALSFSMTAFASGSKTTQSVRDADEVGLQGSFAMQVSAIESLITNETVEISSDNYAIFGNSAMTEEDFFETVCKQDEGVYLHYRTTHESTSSYDALLVLKTATKTYSYEFTERESDDSAVICQGIKEFLKKYSEVLQNKYFITEKDEISAETSSTESSVPTTFIDCNVEKEYVNRFNDKGYIVYHIGVACYTANSASLVYIVTINNSFVPGIVAKKNNESGYNAYKNMEGFVHMEVDQAYDATEEYYYGRRWGNIPYKKDYWPVNGPAVVTINSSIQSGLTLGYSFSNGFSGDKLSLSENRNIGTNISYGYSKAITKSEPALSVQVNSSNTDICEWSYTYTENSAETYNLNTNYMFEISNSRNGMFKGDFRLKLDYKMVVKNSGLPWQISTNEYSDDLLVRAGEYRLICRFASGMNS